MQEDHGVEGASSLGTPSPTQLRSAARSGTGAQDSPRVHDALAGDADHSTSAPLKPIPAHAPSPESLSQRRIQTQHPYHPHPQPRRFSPGSQSRSVSVSVSRGLRHVSVSRSVSQTSARLDPTLSPASVKRDAIGQLGATTAAASGARASRVVLGEVEMVDSDYEDDAAEAARYAGAAAWQQSGAVARETRVGSSERGSSASSRVWVDNRVFESPEDDVRTLSALDRARLRAVAPKHIAEHGPDSPPCSRLVYVAVMNAVFVLTYYALAKFSLDYFSFPGTVASPIWFGSGLAFSYCWYIGIGRAWTGIFVGAALFNFVDLIRLDVGAAQSFAASLLIASGNTIESVALCHLCRSYSVPGTRSKVRVLRHPFLNPQSVLMFVLGAGVTCMVAALSGSLAQRAVLVDWSAWREILLTWYVGDLSGMMVLPPLLLGHQVWVAWDTSGHRPIVGLAAALSALSSSRTLQQVLGELFVGLAALCVGLVLEFQADLPPNTQYHSAIFLGCIAALLRFHWMGGALSVIATSVVAVVGTVNSGGPFVSLDGDGELMVNRSLINTSLFITMLALVVQALLASICDTSVLELALEQRVHRRTTDLRKMNMQLRLEKVNADKARDRATTAAQAKTRFLNFVSHEMRSPLHGLQGTADLLCDTELSPQQRHLIASVQRCGVRLEHVITDVVDLSRLMDGSLPLVWREFDVLMSVDEAIELAYDRSKHADVEVLQVLEPSACVRRAFIGDEGRVTQVVRKLVEFALEPLTKGVVQVILSCVRGKHPDERLADVYVVPSLPRTGTAIEPPPALHAADGTHASAYIQVSVVDSGPGMDVRDMRGLFEPFVDAGGVGLEHGLEQETSKLSLAICAHLVQRMGGSIWGRSTVDSGTALSFTLPLTDDGLAAVLSASMSRRTHTPSGHRRIVEPISSRLGLLARSNCNLSSSLVSMCEAVGMVADVIEPYEDLMVALDRARERNATALLVDSVPGQSFEMFKWAAHVLLEDKAAQTTPKRLVVVLPATVDLDAAQDAPGSSAATLWRKFTAELLEEHGPTWVDRIHVLQRPVHMDALIRAVHWCTYGVVSKEPTPDPSVGSGSSGSANPLTISHARRERRLKLLRSLRVLVADDDAINHTIIESYLSALGIDATFVSNSVAAVDTALHSSGLGFDVVLMDIQMPGQFDGLEAARRIQAGVRRSQVASSSRSTVCKMPRIIAMTASVMAEQTRAYLTVMDDVLCKPFKKADLEAVLVRALRALNGDVD